MPFGLPPFWMQALKQPFPNRNCSFLLFPFLPAMAIRGFFFAHFLPKQVYLYGVLTPLKGLHSGPVWFCFCLRVCVPGMLSDYALGRWVLWAAWSYIITLVSRLYPTHPHDSTFVAWCAWWLCRYRYRRGQGIYAWKNLLCVKASPQKLALCKASLCKSLLCVKASLCKSLLSVKASLCKRFCV